MSKIEAVKSSVPYISPMMKTRDFDFEGVLCASPAVSAGGTQGFVRNDKYADNSMWA